MDSKTNIPRRARAVLYAIYDLADGKVGVPIQNSDVLEHVNRLGLGDMTDAQLEDYRKSVMRRIHMAN